MAPRDAAAEIAKATGTAFGDDSIGAVMSKYDINGDGTFDVGEVRKIVEDVQAKDRANKTLKKMVFLLVGVSFVLLCALVATSVFGAVVGGNAIKESHVSGSAMTALSGEAVQTDSVVSFASVWDIPALPTNTLRKLDTLTVYLTPSAAGAGLASEGELEATLKITSAFKPTGSTAKTYLTTAAGALVFVDATAKAGTVTMADGTAFTIRASSAARRRSLADAQPERLLWTSEAALASGHDHDRRLNFGGALMTSGSFTLMSGSSSD